MRPFNIDSALDSHVVDLMLGDGLTAGYADRRRAVLALRAGIPAAVILAKRRKQQQWIAVTQRKWQSKVSRRSGRQRHHDSWNIREKYVRCHGTPAELP